MKKNNKIECKGSFKNGFGVVPKLLMTSSLNVYEKVLLCYMITFVGGGESCFPSYAKMEKDLGISRATLSKTLNSIIAKKLVKKEKLFPNNPLKHNNKYILNVYEMNYDSLEDELPMVHEMNSRLFAKHTSNNNTINNNNTNNKDDDYKNRRIPYKKLFMDKYLKEYNKEYIFQYGKDNKVLDKLCKLIKTADIFNNVLDNAFKDPFWKDKIELSIISSKINKFMPSAGAQNKEWGWE